MNDNNTKGARPAILMPEKPKLVTANGQPVGDPVQHADALRLEAQAKQTKAVSDVTKLQLYVARMEKAAGRNIDQRIMMGALAVIGAKIIAHSPINKHHQMIQSFMTGVATAVLQTYTPEQREMLAKLGEEAAAEGEDRTGKGVEDPREANGDDDEEARRNPH